MLRLLIGPVLLSAFTSIACAAGGEAITDPAQAGADFKVQGEYLGKVTFSNNPQTTGAQVIALGDGKFQLAWYIGGLPGDGWSRGDKSGRSEGKTDGDATVFRSDNGWTSKIKNGEVNVSDSGGQVVGTLKKVERKSPTEGAKPPAGATALFDGRGVEHFPGAKMTEDHLLMAGATTKDELGDFTLHIEFRTPYMPHSQGQARGNSGVYLQNRYELQVLDSFGLTGENNECGGFYTLKEPAVNMCYPPLAWQTYDIEFTAPRFEGSRKVKNARVSVKHNGVAIHDDYELPKLTPGGAASEASKGPVFLQFHGNPVVYRNIWVVTK